MLRRSIVISMMLLTFWSICYASLDIVAFQKALNEKREMNIWPGYDISQIPLAIFDGEKTYLFHYQECPEGFISSKIDSSVFEMDGKHENIIAHSSADIGGKLAATLLQDGAREYSMLDTVAIAFHEMFHVYQELNMPDISGNEAVVFSFPEGNPQYYQLLMMEAALLEKAINSPTESRKEPLFQAMMLRNKRYTMISPEHVEYERATEWKEGTAFYVENFVRGSLLPSKLMADFQPGKVRLRHYSLGLALGILLDDLYPQWKKEINERAVFLDQLVLIKLLEGQAPALLLSNNEIERFAADSSKIVEQKQEDKKVAMEEFFKRAGKKLIIRMHERKPLFASFDPMNVVNLGNAKILHKRFFKLSNGYSGTITMMNDWGLTVAISEDDPVFSGIKEVTIFIPSGTELKLENGWIKYKNETTTLELNVSTFEDSGETAIVTLN